MARARSRVRRVLSVCDGCDRFRSITPLPLFRCTRASRGRGYRSSNGYETERVPERCDRTTEHATVRALKGL